VTHYAGTGVEGGGGDGGPALQAEFRGPHGLVIGTDGALYVSDTGNNRIRRTDSTSRLITAFVPALAPGGLSAGPDGTLYVTEFEAHRVLRLDRTGNASVVAGTGARGFTGDGGPAIRARLDLPADTAAASDGTLYIVESGPAGRIRKVDPSGRISTLRRR
jgi:DNA-binding beta-propeller fold protein YncE